MKAPIWLRRSAMLLALLVATGPAHAIVGPSQDGSAFAAHVVMVVRHQSFCSGVVVARDIVLTAAHCVATPDTTGVLPAPGFTTIPVRAIVTHPGYRAFETGRQLRSIDLALIRVAAPLPSGFAPVEMSATNPRLASPLTLAGYGVTDETGNSGGTLRRVAMTVRAPLSSVLVWAEDPQHAGAGGCRGDSGGPVFDASNRLVAIMVWASGEGVALCGDLTQAARVAPQAAWIAGVLKQWR